MKTLLFSRWLQAALRLFIGVLFLDAGSIKVRDPQDFAEHVRAFHLLPPAVAMMVARDLPWLEMICGALLIGGWCARSVLFSLLLLNMTFIAALGQALFRGIDLDCGCFGSRAATHPTLWLSLGSDLILLVLICLAYLSCCIRTVATIKEGL